MSLRRRHFLFAAGAVAAAPLARAQAPAKVATLGILNPHPKAAMPKGPDNPVAAVLRKRGWVVGKNLRIDAPDAGGSEARMPEVATALVEKKVDVILALGPDAALAAARATSTIPIVFWGVAYPVEQGLIHSYTRPGRNVTGVPYAASPEIEGKRLELLREIAPAAKRLAFLAVASALPTVSGGQVSSPTATAERARALGYDVRSFFFDTGEGLEAVFAAIREWRAEALIAQPSTLINRERRRIIDFCNRSGLPSVFTLPDYVVDGGLVSYAIDWRPTMARCMDYVDRILRGANPAELPVELPSRYELAVNLKTARLLGLTVPRALLLRADRVIE